MLSHLAIHEVVNLLIRYVTLQCICVATLSHPLLRGHIRHILPPTTFLSHLQGAPHQIQPHFCLIPTKMPRKIFSSPWGCTCTPWLRLCPGPYWGSSQNSKIRWLPIASAHLPFPHQRFVTLPTSLWDYKQGSGMLFT